MNDRQYREGRFKGKQCSPVTRRRGNSRDTKRWCKGVEGREHQKQWIPSHKLRDWYDLKCTACEKQFDYCSGFFKTDRCKCGHHKQEAR